MTGGARAAGWVYAAVLIWGCAEVRDAMPVAPLRIKDVPLRCEVAHTQDRRARGYMHRREIPEGTGMLFLFSAPRYLVFHMANTPVPLSIAFVDADGVIRQIEDMQPYDLRTTQSAFAVPSAIEVPQGWFARKGIGIGDRVEGIAEARRLYPPLEDM